MGISHNCCGFPSLHLIVNARHAVVHVRHVAVVGRQGEARVHVEADHLHKRKVQVAVQRAKAGALLGHPVHGVRLAERVPQAAQQRVLFCGGIWLGVCVRSVFSNSYSRVLTNKTCGDNSNNTWKPLIRVSTFFT